MPAIRGITVAVGEWYAKTLEITLARNMRHLTACLVVTTPGDEAVKEVVSRVPGARTFETDVFTYGGARFNKGWAMELGFTELGRDGWIAIWDCDCLWPDAMPFDQLKPDHLHGMRRRILEDPTKWSPDLNWRECPLRADGGAVGFAQIFHADDPALSTRPNWYDASDPNLVGGGPWYDISFAHAGGGDAAFMDRWHRSKINVFPVDCLHLGPVDTNWWGCDAEARDIMAAFVARNGWTRGRHQDPSAVHRVGEITERVEVPGYPVSTYDLPFVRRAKARRGQGQ